MMRLAANKPLVRELIHWMWLWVLAAIAIAVIQSMASGAIDVRRGETGIGGPTMVESQHDDPDLRETHPFGPNLHPLNVDPNRQVSLSDILAMNRTGDFRCVIDAWDRIELHGDSRVWKQIGVAVAYLRLDELDAATRHLDRALEIDPESAAAHYFLGRVYEARRRQVPFWYEADRKSPFQLAVATAHQLKGRPDRDEPGSDGEPRTFLPHHRGDRFAAKAKQHFRRAIELAQPCDLDQLLEWSPKQTQPIRLTSASDLNHSAAITARDLMESFGEGNYLERAQRAAGMRVA